jgi:hypothetical protein
VVFEVVTGGASLDRTSSRTDLDGIAEAVLVLGPSQGVAEVRARITTAIPAPQAGEAQFTATGIGAPELASVSATEGERRSDVTLVGRNFSPILEHNVVEFNGVQADIESGGVDRLTVVVPAFASDGAVTVTLTGVRSNGLPFKVLGPPPLLPDIGSVEVSTLAGSAPGQPGEVRLGFLTGSEEYAVIVQSLSTHPTSVFSHSITSDLAFLPGAPKSAGGPAPAARPVAGPQERLDATLRGWEAELARQAQGKSLTPGLGLAQAPPQVGDELQFKVINTADPNAFITDARNFTTVDAVLRYVGDHTLVYVDERVGGLNLTDADIRQVGDRFDDETYGVDRNVFGDESDINGDGTITILLTAVVNGLSENSGPEEGITVGFFFGLDLLPQISPPTSNAREIFYGFVPDPAGQFGPVISKGFALATLDEVFAHEFQHMISFNEHVLRRAGQSEDLWLNEGLSHVAEDLNGFPEGNKVRAALYLDEPGATPLARSGAGNTLSERGAAFIFLRHLADQFGQGVYKSLVQTRFTGQANLQFVTGKAFAQLFNDWMAALFLDDSGFGSDPRFQISTLNLRAIFEEVRTEHPDLVLNSYLNLRTLQVPGGGVSGSTVGTTGSFYLVGTGGGTNERRLKIAAPASSASQVTVIRTR